MHNYYLFFLFLYSTKHVDLIQSYGGGAKMIRKQGKNFSMEESHFYVALLVIICFHLAKQVWTVGNKNMCPCAHQKGTKAVFYK
jgi:hypothetical protein